MIKVAVIFGTRPEVIKMFPIIKKLEIHPDIRSIIISTSQHREMLDQSLKLFSLKPDYDLNIMTEYQTLLEITNKTMVSLYKVIDESRPDMILVEGDTTTAFIGALIGFYHRIPVGHVEAGLRSFEKYSPYPEEINRRLIASIADLHFAPTQENKKNLLCEGIKQDRIYVTGNTGIDTLLMSLNYINQKTGGKNVNLKEVFQIAAKENIRNDSRILLVTVHRRENWGHPIKNICAALKQLTNLFDDIEVVYPVHLNPYVQKPVFNLLKNTPRIHLVKPLSYYNFIRAMDKSYLILSDSGGVQEEAPALGKPVLVLRMTTERPEGVSAGTAKVVGIETKSIVNETAKLLSDSDAYNKMAKAVSPYGDGRAAERIIEGLLHYMKSKKKNSVKWQSEKVKELSWTLKRNYKIMKQQ